MSFSPLPPVVYLSACRIETRFDDGKSEFGSGFLLIGRKKEYYLITARHVVDPKYRPPNDGQRNAVATEIVVYCRAAENRDNAGKLTIDYRDYLAVEIARPKLTFPSDDCDCCVVPLPSGVGPIVAVGVELLLDFQTQGSCLPGDLVCYVGFPKGAPAYFSDSSILLPVHRQGVLAIPTFQEIEVPGTIGKRYGLIDSYAKSGFSGSPLFALPRAEIPYRDHGTTPARPGALLGLIAGHYTTSDDRSQGQHAGISYYSMSASIALALSELNSHPS